MAWVYFCVLFCILLNISLISSSPYDCNVFNNSNLTWLAVYNGYTGAGTAYYYPNGTLITYSSTGELDNIGQWRIEDGPEYCYEYETYSYPPDAADTCNTYSVCEDGSIIGCEILQDNCQPYKTCDGHWENWYAARKTEQ